MIHPRDLYIRACQEVSKFPGFDYFDHGSFTHMQTVNTKLKALARAVLNPTSAPQRLRDCFMYFQDMDARIYLEGLLLSYSTGDIAQLNGFKPEFIEDYKSYFFDIDFQKNTFFSHLFLNSIIEDEVKAWFTRCQQVPFGSMYTVLTGKAKERDALAVLRETRSKMESFSDALMPNELIANPSNINNLNKFQIQEARKFAQLSAKLAYDELRLGNKAKSSQNKTMQNDWRELVKKKPATVYDAPLHGALDEQGMSELQEQVDIFPGLKVADTEKIAELSKQKDSD